MNIEQWPIDRPKPYEKNARKIPQSAIDKVAKSLSEFGWHQPIVVDKAGVIIAGHTRLLSAKKLGLKTVPVTVATDLTPAKVRQYRLMDNRSHDETSWDYEILSDEMSSLPDIDLSGFTLADMRAMVSWAKDAPAKNSEADELQKKWKTAIGQKWKVGKHVYHVNDSLTIEPIKCDGVCSDPPYELAEDKVGAIVFRHTDKAILMLGDSQCGRLSALYHNSLGLVWRRRRPRSLPTKNRPISYHQVISVFTMPGVKSGWKRPRPDYGSVIETENEYEDSRMGHGKAADVFVEMLAGFQWDVVCDPFGGTGATLIACEATQRRCIAVEMNPTTAAVALQRFTDAGLRAVLAAS